MGIGHTIHTYISMQRYCGVTQTRLLEWLGIKHSLTKVQEALDLNLARELKCTSVKGVL